ncbi:fimbrial biogenesis outer membrane usher protein, partial [Escherichia coli]
LPFGALVSDSHHQELGYVAQGSQIFVKSDAQPEAIRINTSKGKIKKSCVITQPTEHAVNICR